MLLQKPPATTFHLFGDQVPIRHVSEMLMAPTATDLCMWRFLHACRSSPLDVTLAPTARAVQTFVVVHLNQPARPSVALHHCESTVDYENVSLPGPWEFTHKPIVALLCDSADRRNNRCLRVEPERHEKLTSRIWAQS